MGTEGRVGRPVVCAESPLPLGEQLLEVLGDLLEGCHEMVALRSLVDHTGRLASEDGSRDLEFKPHLNNVALPRDRLVRRVAS
jgi:hypothetical protein